jgi:quercetin dioxygenase-like cupin family protein
MIVAAGGGEVIGDSPERRVEILCETEALHATWSRFGPGRAGADLHVHRHHSDVFYVLDGELTIRLGHAGAETVASAGTVAIVPPLVVHGFRNGSDAEMRYLNFHVPGSGFADYMRGLRDGRTVTYDQHPPPQDGGRSPDAVLIARPPVVADAIAIEVADGGDVDFGYVLDGPDAGAWVQGEAVAARVLSVRPSR